MVSTSQPSKVHSKAGTLERTKPDALPAREALTMKLSMVTIEKGGLILVASEGSITAADVDPGAPNPLQTLLGATWSSNRVLLNLEQTPYIDSSAIGWLISTRKTFADAGGAIVVYHVQPAVRQLLDMLKISRVLPIGSNEAEARELLSGGAK